jgi:predicted transcriptional regulator of viral defense system
MRFFDFEKRMMKSPVFTSAEAKTIFFNSPNILIQVSFWVKKRYIKRVRKGVYVLSQAAQELDPMLLAEKIYSPSYLSLEFALNYHSIIPDIPGTYTSISTKKTMRYKNEFGNYSYQKIKKDFFTGYVSLGNNLNLATPEKAMMDYLYFNQSKLVAKVDFWRELRIDENFSFNRKKIETYKKLFKNKKVSELMDSLLAYQKNAG